MAFVVLSAIFGLIAGVAFFTLPSLLLGWFQGGVERVHRVHNIGWGASAGLLFAVPMLGQVRNPDRQRSSFLQLPVFVVTMLIAALLSVEFDMEALSAIVVFTVMTLVLFALHPARSRLLADGPRPSIPMLALTLLGALPLVVYALDMAELQRTGPPSDPHVELVHWLTMALLALAIITGAGLASLRLPGWRVSAWLAGLAAAVFGVASIVLPDDPGAVGQAWGATALAGGLLFIGVAEWERRRTGDADQPSSG